MALLEEQFTESESLDAGATPIKYEGDVERQREVAEKLWAQLNPQQQMEFGSFEQFFSSGAWKKVLELIMQQQRGEGQNIMEGEGAGVMEQGMGMQAPPLPPTPSPMVNPGAGAAAPGPAGGMGQKPIMPQPRPAMARGGIAELFEEEEIEEPGFDEIEEEEVIEGPKGKFRRMLERAAMRSLRGPKDPSALTAGMMSRMRETRNIMEPMGGTIPMGGTMERTSFPRPGQSISGGLPAALPSGQIRTGTGGAPEMRPRLASHDPEDASSEAWFNLWKEHPQGHLFPTLDKFISWYVDTTDYDPDRMAEGGRIGYGLGSFVKKAFKKAKRAVKKVVKSPVGKAALAGLALYATRGMWGPAAAGLKGKMLGTAAIGGPPNFARAATSGILGAGGGLGLTAGAGSFMPTAMGGLGMAMAAPYLFPNLGKPKDLDTPEIGGRGDSPDIDVDEITRTVQEAYKSGPDAVAALQQRFPYLLPYGSAKLAEGGRIGYQDAGPVGSSEAQDAWADLEAAPKEQIQITPEGITKGGESFDVNMDYMNALQNAEEAATAKFFDEHPDASQDSLRLRFMIKELRKNFGDTYYNKAQGGRIGYGLGSWLKGKIGLGRREGRAEAAPGRVQVAQDPDVMRGKLMNYFKAKVGGKKYATPHYLSGVATSDEDRKNNLLDYYRAKMSGQNYAVPGMAEGGLMDLGGMEKDYRQEGGFVPLGGEEKADDVPARLSKNEFVFTADAVRSAGGGDIDQGAEVMENVMNNLEQGGQISEESQGLQGARDMFATSERLSEVV